MLALDRWAVDRAYQLQQDVIEAYDTYQFHLIYQKVHHFCSVDLGSFYLDVTKDRQYTCRGDGIPRRSAQTACYHIVEALTRWLDIRSESLLATMASWLSPRITSAACFARRKAGSSVAR